MRRVLVVMPDPDDEVISMKCFVGQTVALISLIVPSAATAQAQNRGVSPMHYINPFNQSGMYNNAPGMYYNNPFN